MHKENINSLQPPKYCSLFKHLRLLLFTLCCWFLTPGTLLASTDRFEFTDLLKEAYLKSTNLELDAAARLVDYSRLHDPDNLINELVSDYIDFFKIFINQDQSQLRQLEGNKSVRLDRIRRSETESPYRLYALAEINLHWGLIYLQNRSYLTAYAHIKKAYKYLTKNRKAWPEFMDIYKSLGILHATVGSIPKHFRKVFSFFSGMKGTIEQGKSEMNILLDHINSNPSYLFKDETYTLYTLLLVHLNNEGEEAWQVIQRFPFSERQSPLISFCRANIAMRTYRNDEALKILNNFKPKDEQWPFYYLDFMTGLTLTRKLDPRAKNYFQKFIEQHPGENYKKESYQKLAWLELLENNIAGYQAFMREVEQQGENQIDGDKNALKEARASIQGKMPHRELLKARLLFDGGYFNQALEILLSAQDQIAHDQNWQLEFHYRLARTYHLRDDLPNALKAYQRTVDEGIYAPEYYACSAALQMGLIYEAMEDRPKAIKFFKYCLSLNPEDYRTSLHMKAEAGLNRVKG